jgi:hypothetical protein
MPSPGKRFVYVLTGWQERPAVPDRPAVWRFSLENTRAPQRHSFGDLRQLKAFLEAQVEAEQPGRGERQKE